MKNKKLMLIAIGAMGFVALGAAGVGTAAWFQVGSAAKVNVQSDTASLSTVAGSLTVGTFRLTAVPSGETTVELTAANGKSYGYMDDAGTNKVEVAPTNGVATFSCAIKVTYVKAGGEGEKSASDIKAIWDATIAGMTAENLVVTVSAAKTAGRAEYTTSSIRWLPSNSASATAGDYKTINVSKTNLAALTWAGASLDSSTNAAGSNSVYVAITGEDGIDTTAPAFTFTFAPGVPAGLVENV